MDTYITGEKLKSVSAIIAKIMHEDEAQRQNLIFKSSYSCLLCQEICELVIGLDVEEKFLSIHDRKALFIFSYEQSTFL